MNFLGHGFVAFKILGRLNDLVAVGSQLPDIVPFVDQKVFTFDEIHESPENLYYFVKKKYPKQIDLPLSMMTHSIKFGVDEFNKKIKAWLIDDKRELQNITKQIMKVAQLDYKTASGPRLHNYLWTGMDVYLLKEEAMFIKRFHQNLLDADLDFISKILSKSYAKDEKMTKKIIQNYLQIFRVDKINQVEDIALIFKRKTKSLSEGDKVNVREASKLFNEIYKTYITRWPIILNRLIILINNQMSIYL